MTLSSQERAANIVRRRWVKMRPNRDWHAARLKEKFHAASPWHRRERRSRILSTSVLLIAGAGFGAVIGFALLEAYKPWPVSTIVQHFAAARNCDTARAVGLAPAYRGEPGYWSKLDADNDGIACEHWSGPRRSSGAYRR